MLATGGAGGVVKRWIANAVSLSQVGDSTQRARCVRVAGDGSIIHCGSDDDSGSVWLCPQDEQDDDVKFAAGVEVALTCCDIDKSCRLVCAGGESGVAYVWDVKRRKVVRRLEGDDEGESPVHCLRLFEGTTGMCIAASSNSSVSLRSVRTRRELDRLPCPRALSLEFSPTRRNLLAASGRDCVYIWDVSRASLVTKLSTDGPGASVSFSPLNQKFLASADGASVTFWDMDASRSVKSLDCLASHVAFVTERVVCLGLADGQLKSYDLRNTSQPVAEVAAHPGPISSMHFSSVEKRKKSILSEEERDIVPRSPADETPASSNGISAQAHSAQSTPPPVGGTDEDDDEGGLVSDKIENLHIDMLRQFQIQHTQLSALISDYSDKLTRLVDENDKLRRENQHLRATVADLGGILPETDSAAGIAKLEKFHLRN